MISCPACAFENPDHHRQCDRCGTPLPSSTVRRDELDRDVLELARQGKTVEAIRLLRERTGIGLAEAKQVVDAIREREELFRASSERAPTHSQDSLDEDILALCRQGKKIQAVQRYRSATGRGLKKSKDAVDELCARHGIPVGSGCVSMAVVAVAIGMILGLLGIWE